MKELKQVVSEKAEFDFQQISLHITWLFQGSNAL